MERKIPDKVYKKLEFDDLEIKSIDEKKRVIWHKITKEVKDRMGDIVRIDGLNLKQFKKKPGVLADHNYWGGNPPPVVAEGIGFKREGKALYAGTKFFDPNNEEMSQALRDLSKDHFALQKMKLLGWSIGFIPKKTEIVKDKDDKFQGFDFKEAELLEYSSVVIPANQEAITDAFQKGFITKELADKWPRKDLLPGEIAEEILTQEDVGKTEEDFEGQEDIDAEIVMKPYENEHACRLKDPKKYKRFTRGKRKHDGKEYSIIFGWYEKDDKEVSEEQAYRYKKDIWTEGEAKKHCKDHKGTFEAAKDEEKCEDCESFTIEEPAEQGILPDDIKALTEAIDRLLKKIEHKNKLKKILENLKRR